MVARWTKKRLSKQWLWGALAAYVVMLVVNSLAGSTTFIGGIQTGDVSDIYANLFAPAGFTFSIWGVIYLLLAGFLLRAFGVIRTRKPQIKPDAMNQALMYTAVTSALNVLWLLAWQYQVLWLSVIIMLGLLVALIRVVTLLHSTPMSRAEYWLVRVPFSVYLGWISVATIANVTAWLVSVGWNGFGVSEGAWTIIVLIVGGVIALLHGFAKRDAAYVAVFVWAYFGILFKHLSEGGFDLAYPSVIVSLAVLLPVLAMTTVQLIREEPRLRIGRR